MVRLVDAEFLLQVGLTLILPALILASTLLAYLTMLGGTWCICAVAKPVAPLLSEKTLFPPLNLPVLRFFEWSRRRPGQPS